ncbi:MAG: hypothetical protein HW421_1167 [Ignavibacteria bacterium]|nr:hypothetical protein [Ignavibacteria bacterium]
MRKLMLGILIFSIVIMLNVGCYKNSDQKDNKNEKITICQWGQALIYLPLYVANEKGFFKDEGLDVNITSGNNSDLDTWLAVQSGSAQFAISDPTMIAIQREKGGPKGVLLGDIVQRVAFWAVSLDTNLKEITSPKNFKGQSIACFKFPNTAHALALRTFQLGNLQVGTDVKMVEVDYSAVLAQLKRGDATLAMLLEPAASNSVVHGGAKIVYSYPEAWGEFAFTGLTATSKYVKEHPEIVQKVLNALERAMIFIRKDPNGAIKVGNIIFPDLDTSVIKLAVERMINSKTIPENITPSKEGWIKAIDVCIEVGKLKDKKNTSELIDDSFAKKSVEKFNKK